MRNRVLTSRGFTLVELLTVIAISAVLIGLLMWPLYQSFGLVRSAQSMVDAQDGARRAIAQVTRDLSEAMYVYNNVDSVSLPVRARDPNGEGLQTMSVLTNARVDMILPEMIVHCNNNDPLHDVDPPPGRDFSRRDERFPNLALALPPCPVCGSSDHVEIRPKLPMKHDSTIIRYFLGLRNNDLNWSDATGTWLWDTRRGWKSWDLTNTTSGVPNPVVLYRVEFDPNDPNFANYNDPDFFYSAIIPDPSDPDSLPYWKSWAQIAVPVSSTKYQDLVTADYVASGADAGTPIPQTISPTVQFRFAGVDNVQFVGNNSKTVTGIPIPSTVFRAPDGYWSTLNSVSVYRKGPLTRHDGTVVSIPTEFTAKLDFTTAPPPDPLNVLIYKYKYTDTEDPPGTWNLVWGLDEDLLPLPVGGRRFNVTEYLTSGNILLANGRNAEMAFYYNANKGQVNFALKPQPPVSPVTGLYPIPYPYTDPIGGPPVDPILNIERVSPIYPAVINADSDRRALLSTFDAGDQAAIPPLPASSNYLANASVVPSSVKVYVAESDVTSPIGYRWVRYHLVPEGGFKAGPREFWIEAPGWIRFGDNVPVVTADPDNVPSSGDELVLPVLIDYDVQYNHADDIVVGSYVTKSRIQIGIGMNVYDAISRRPNLFSLTEIVPVGNALR